MPPNTEQNQGLMHLECRHSVQETMTRLESVLREHGLRIFALIDHSAAAAEVGLEMRPVEVLIFGNPSVGTPMMLAAPSLAIDLPFKALVWEDHLGKVWLTYNTPEYLKKRHGVPGQLIENLNGLANLLREVVK